MLIGVSKPRFGWSFSDSAVLRPVSAMGVAVTPGTAPTKGSWVAFNTPEDIPYECFGVLVNINSSATAATTRNVHVDIGIDQDGGTAFSTLIPDLLGGHASSYTTGGGIWYYFPIYVPAYSTLAVRAAGNVTTAIRASIKVFGHPSNPESLTFGSFVRAFGATTSNATGTAITLGTTADGSWTKIGADTAENLWWWQMGYTCADTTMSAAALHFDLALGTATSKTVVTQDKLVIVTASEEIISPPALASCVGYAPSGAGVYIRGQSSTAADTSPSVMAWGLGG